MRLLDYGGDGWWPRWAPDQGWLVFGNQQPTVWQRTSGVLTSLGAGRMARWIAPNVVTFVVEQAPGRMLRYEAMLDPSKPVNPVVASGPTGDDPALVAGNEFDAGGDTWASWLADGHRLAINNAIIEGEYLGVAVNRQGHVLTTRLAPAASWASPQRTAADWVRQRRLAHVSVSLLTDEARLAALREVAPVNFVLFDAHGRVLGETPLPPRANEWRLSDTDVVTSGYWWEATAAYFNGVTEDVTITPHRREGVPQIIQASSGLESWIWRPTEDPDTTEPYFIGHPHGSPPYSDRTLVVGWPDFGVVDFDVCADAPAGWLLAGCTDRGRLLVDAVPPNEPRVPVAVLFEDPDPPRPPAPPVVTVRTYGPAEGVAPLDVHIDIATAGEVTSIDYLWRLQGAEPWTTAASFDGQTLSYRYTFPRGGVYQVGVRVTGPGGQDQTGRPRYVTVTLPPELPVPPNVPPPTPVTLVTSGDVHLTAEEGGGPQGQTIDERPVGLVTAREDTPGPWQTFAFVRRPEGRVALLSSNGFWLCAEEGGGRELVANRPTPGPYEEFLPVPGEGEGPLCVALRTHGRDGDDQPWYVHAHRDGKVRADSRAVHAEETFTSSVSLFPGVSPSTDGANAWQRVAGRVRVSGESGRFVDDAGAWAWLGLSEFDCIHLARTGQLSELHRRLNRAQQTGRTILRVLGMAVNLFDLRPDQPGFWEAVETVLDEAAARGLRVELVIFADAQHVMPEPDDRHALVDEWTRRYGTDPRVVFQVANEPWQNGFESAVDPALFALAEQLRARLGHGDFSVGDAPDGDNVDASRSTIEQTIAIARHCNIAVLHSSRLEGCEPDGEGRLRRWVDHLEGFDDVLTEVRRAVGRPVAGVHDEPMGAASQRWVPIPGRDPYEREYDPHVLLAADLTTWFIGAGHCYHHISPQDDGCPGLDLIGSLVAGLNPSSGWRYRNDSWDGSPTHGFTWQGGKCRSWVGPDGREAYTFAYGTHKGAVTWVSGWAPVVIYDSREGETPITFWHSVRR